MTKYFLDFRPLHYKDLEFFLEVRNSVCEDYLHNSTKFTLLDATKWYAKGKPEYYIISMNGTDIGYFRTSNLTNNTIYMGADLHEEYRGKGIGYEAYLKFIPFIIKKYNLSKIYLEVLATNSAAIRLYTKLRFKKTGIKKADVKKGEIWVDSIIMCYNNEE